jgi:thiamine pyrophosphate-dependent acetolactate synthase large subunit-like protein
MLRDVALGLIAQAAEEAAAAVFVGNGNNARAMCALADSGNVFYMLGSMSMCPSIAAGYSHACGKSAIAVEGDGNALMGLSALPAVVAAARTPFVHVVLDNGRYETTGSQRTLSPMVSLPGFAIAAGYDSATTVTQEPELRQLLKAALHGESKVYLHVPTELETKPQHPRVPYAPAEVVGRFAPHRKVQ